MMYSTKPRLHLDPDTDNLGGGGGAPETGPASGEGAPASPSFDPDAFRSEFSGLLREELGRGLGQIRSEIETRLTPAQERAQESNEAPSMEDRKYLNAQGELDAKGFQRWQADLYKHMSKAERSEWEKENQTRQTQLQSESQIREAKRAHVARESEYSKANPTYQQDILRAGDMEVNPSVGRRILSSKYSAHIIHHFAKNKADFSQFQGLSYDDPEGAIEMLGELGARFKASENASSRPSIPVKPTRGAFGGGGSRPAARSMEEMKKDWN